MSQGNVQPTNMKTKQEMEEVQQSTTNTFLLLQRLCGIYKSFCNTCTQYQQKQNDLLKATDVFSLSLESLGDTSLSTKPNEQLHPDINAGITNVITVLSVWKDGINGMMTEVGNLVASVQHDLTILNKKIDEQQKDLKMVKAKRQEEVKKVHKNVESIAKNQKTDPNPESLAEAMKAVSVCESEGQTEEMGALEKALILYRYTYIDLFAKLKMMFVAKLEGDMKSQDILKVGLECTEKSIRVAKQIPPNYRNQVSFQTQLMINTAWLSPQLRDVLKRAGFKPSYLSNPVWVETLMDTVRLAVKQGKVPKILLQQLEESQTTKTNKSASDEKEQKQKRQKIEKPKAPNNTETKEKEKKIPSQDIKKESKPNTQIVETKKEEPKKTEPKIEQKSQTTDFVFHFGRKSNVKKPEPKNESLKQEPRKDEPKKEEPKKVEPPQLIPKKEELQKHVEVKKEEQNKVQPKVEKAKEIITKEKIPPTKTPPPPPSTKPPPINSLKTQTRPTHKVSQSIDTTKSKRKCVNYKGPIDTSTTTERTSIQPPQLTKQASNPNLLEPPQNLKPPTFDTPKNATTTTQSTGRQDLLSDIRKGTTLKPPTITNDNTVTDDQYDDLSMMLKKVIDARRDDICPNEEEEDSDEWSS
ncbi:triadin, putative [Entamoeba invadens IP1]|uniref:triadin, putative n=1 Tax=Entamoeba invadens IP1 TaxID=370355 RepID=UPI0002C3E3AF|nr:triadin, putative [Entamoeba invadens IP1]ELP93007.1 triadin, putative [Entamoeba invadens IP1]|eukprot:XP_004259778.1 triadin, putative [Entamoeba invadens IP1]